VSGQHVHPPLVPRSVHFRFILVIGATGLIATATGAYLIGQRFIRQVRTKVPQDIDLARVIYEHEVEKGQDTVRLTDNRLSVCDATRVKDTVLLQRALHQVRENEGLDRPFKKALVRVTPTEQIDEIIESVPGVGLRLNLRGSAEVVDALRSRAV